MKVYLKLDENNLVLSAFTENIEEGLVEYEVNDLSDIKVLHQHYIHGEVVTDKDYKEHTQEYFEKLSRIQELKKLLDDSDYKLFKYLEGVLSEEEYLPIKTLRQSYRDEINRLEEELE